MLQYQQDQGQLMDFLRQYKQVDWSLYQSYFNPYPIKLEYSFFKQARVLQQVIVKAVVAIVAHYLEDVDLQAKLSLTDQCKTLLKLAAHRPYQIGVLRPDFIIDTQHQLRVGEINACFTTNGIILSNYLVHYFQKRTDHRAIEDVVPYFAHLFDRQQRLRIVKGRESGYDIHCLYRELANLRYDIAFVDPKTLKFDHNCLLAAGLPCRQFILELHQEELLCLPEAVLHHLISQTHYLNDIRTLLIVHDKRLLSILCDQHIMQRYLSNSEVRLLQQHIIETHVIHTVNKHAILSYPECWVFKKTLSGKGEGMYLGCDTPLPILSRLLDTQSNHYVIQRYIKQAKYPILVMKDGKLQHVPQHLVGMLASYNLNTLGVGFFRASPNSIVNISTQGGEVITVI